MKHLLIIITVLFGLLPVINAQDVIIRKNGSEVKVKVLEVNINQVKYKHSDNLDGPVYSEDKQKILKIKYANGLEDVFVKENIPATTGEQVAWQTPQEKKVPKVRYSGSVEVSPYLGFNYSDKADYYQGNSVYTSAPDSYSGVGITTTHGIRLMDKYYFGMGIGLNFQSEGEIFIPVYTNFKLDLSRGQARPFLSFSLGMQIGDFSTDDYYDEYHITAGLWSNILFGYKFKNKLYVAGGITVQNAYRDYYYNDDWYNEELYGMVGLMASVGFRF